jgi:2'-5' RNA ligase
MSSTTANGLRLFLALWPDEVTRDRLAAISRSVAGKHAIDPFNLHLTLVFLGATADERRLCYEQALHGLPVPHLQIPLNRLGYWPKSSILWLGPDKTPANLIKLVAELNQRLSNCGFRPERRRFRAHVTLARNHARIPPPLDEVGEPFSWHTNQIVLVKSITGSDRLRYDVIRCWHP